MDDLLKQKIDEIPQAPYPAHSRIHPLNSLKPCYVKRDDELGFGISGSKIRKYRSLIPFLLNHAYDEVVVIGSLYSNNVLSVTQLLIESKIKFTLYLRGDPNRQLQGNALLLSLMTSFENIVWFTKEAWETIEASAMQYQTSSSRKVFVLKEGSSVAEALPGALTLPLDIIKNEADHQVKFDHIFVETGTGLMAIALILGFSFFQRKTTIHVIQLVGDKDYFFSQLSFFHKEFENLMGMKIPMPQNFILYPSKEGFAKINEELFKEIKVLAREEGFLTDPIYTARLFKEVRKISQTLQGNILVNHSGGALTLMGFENRIITMTPD